MTTLKPYAAALLASLLAAPVLATIGLPVSFSLDSADPLRSGQPVTITVTMQPAISLPHAVFEVLPSKSWQVLDGTTRFAGALRQGETVEFRFRAVPLSDRPEALQGSLRADGYLVRVAGLDPARVGGRFPEQMKGDGSEFDPGTQSAPPPTLRFDPGVALPQPLPPTHPRLPDQQAQPAPRIAIPTVAAGSKSARAASVTINATGRFTYRDAANVVHGVRSATVELFDKNPLPLPHTLCATGVTDSQGNFELEAFCGDFFDGPDLYVRIVLNNSFVEVRPASVLAGSYTFQTATINNFNGGTASFGTITINQNQAAFHAHNILMRSHAYMQAYDQPLPKVTALWPSTGTFYVGVVNTISLDTNVPFAEEGDVIHEFGHHVLFSRAESPIPNYSNGICDSGPVAGHCIYSPEEGVVSWTEGWPNFFAAVVHNQYNGSEQWGTTRYVFEQRQDTSGFAGQEDKIEGVIAAILWDIIDTPADDQFENGSGRRDNLDLTFTTTWNVIRNFDPSSSLAHNHPTSIHEFWDGLRELQPSMSNRLSEVYREHQIVKPQPDIAVTSFTAPPSRLTRGNSYSLPNTVRNNGNEPANSSFTVTFRLVRKDVFPTQIVLGSRSVGANLNAGASNSVSTTVTVPATTSTGSWLLMACADTGDTVPESNESNNCLSAGAVVVQ